MQPSRVAATVRPDHWNGTLGREGQAIAKELVTAAFATLCWLTALAQASDRTNELSALTAEAPAVHPTELVLERGLTAAAKPEWSNAMLPVHDGGSIFVSFPVAASLVPESVTKVFEGGILPLIKVLGFRIELPPDAGQPGCPTLLPPAEGVTLKGSDLRQVALLQSSQGAGDEASLSPTAKAMLRTFLEQPGQVAPEVDSALEAAWGMPYEAYRSDIQREQIVYPYTQVFCGVPIEHTMLLAAGWGGQGITSIRGSLIHHHRPKPDNARPDCPRTADCVDAALDAWARRTGLTLKRVGEPTLVLLPFGTDPDRKFRLMYAWRFGLQTTTAGKTHSFRVWMDPTGPDAGTHRPFLKVQALTREAEATGHAPQPASGVGWRKDPGAVRLRPFEVDAARSHEGRGRKPGLVLELDSVSRRVTHQGIPQRNVFLPGSVARFDVPPFIDAGAAVCGHPGGNPYFQQIHLFSLMRMHRHHAMHSGVFASPPPALWQPFVEVGDGYCGADSTPMFAACSGYYARACPNFSTGKVAQANLMNYAHDGTIVAHEMAHDLIDAFTRERPKNWCARSDCPEPLGWSALHDLADAWSNHVHDTNCTGGWVAKNQGGVNASLDCQGTRGHSHDFGLPRLHELSVPFHPASPGDHFPERRKGSDEYADMEIAAAALWQVREGMRALDPVSGTTLFQARFLRALRMTGFGKDPGTSDRGIYRRLVDLEIEMIDQWATAGAADKGNQLRPPATSFSHNTNKVLAGFAKAGIFPIRAECLDDPAPKDVHEHCPPGKTGAEAVIDIDDGEPEDDIDTMGQPSPDHERLRIDGPAPVFHVWTGARFRFRKGEGQDAPATLGQAPCHSHFQVELSVEQGFPAGAATLRGPWLRVDTNTATPATPECYGRWSPTPSVWKELLEKAADGSRLYYRARTGDTGEDGGPHQRISTEPGAGTWHVLPPFAVISTLGRPRP